ncbi:hypothetical protein MLD38_033872 [Melastoma candidum]|uniref:Uncharacterized protein n=1 Tax=Melastoma candidum TaxID=119954 RepID=A0ACB9M9I0_9MYRT|nr:hypothetical protein MLD38_033872 [Melastoma candidum]
MIQDTRAEQIWDYLDAFYETWRLIEILEDSSFDVSGRRNKTLGRAHDVMLTAMTRLEDEFKHILLQISSFEDSHPLDNMSRASRYCMIDLVNLDSVRELCSIAKAMFASRYGKECSQVPVSVRRDSLDEILFVLELERQSIVDALRMEWDVLN